MSRTPRYSDRSTLAVFPRLRTFVVGFCLSDHARSRRCSCGTAALGGVVLGFPITRSPHVPPPPSPVIPDWRRFEPGHPKPSQIGVSLTHRGTDWRRVERFSLCVPQPALSEPCESNGCPLWLKRLVWLIAICQLLFAFSKILCVSHPWALPEFSQVRHAFQLRISTS